MHSSTFIIGSSRFVTSDYVNGLWWCHRFFMATSSIFNVDKKIERYIDIAGFPIFDHFD